MATLASAWVSVAPSGFADFAAKARDGIKTALSRINPQVPVGANVKPALGSIDDLRAKLDELRLRRADVSVGLNDKAAKAALLALDVKMVDLGKKVAKPNIDVRGTAKALADIAAVDLALDKVGKAASSNGNSGGGGILGTLTGILANPYTITAGIIAALSALPFIAQAAAGGMVFALGAGLAAIAVAGAAKTKIVQQSFATLAGNANKSLLKIGAPFIPVLLSIAKTAESVLSGLTPIFAGAAQTIAGPFRAFSDALLKAFGSPQVKSSIQGVATAFGKLLTALTPGLSGDVNELATGVEKVAAAVAKNPQAFATFINDIFKIAQVSLSVIADLTNVATYIESHFRPAIHEIAVIFDGMRHEVVHILDDLASYFIRRWNATWAETIGATINEGHAVEAQFDHLRVTLAATWAKVSADVSQVFTRDIPALFDAGVKASGKVWSNLENTIKVPVQWVLQHVINPFFGDINDVLSFVGSKTRLPTGLSLARGGRVPGSGYGDTVPAMLTPGEVVVPRGMVAAGAVDHLRGALPGFAAGGLVGIPGGGVLSNIGNAIGGLFSGAGDVAGILLALATGNATAARNDFRKLLGTGGAGGASGELATVLTGLPTTLISDVVNYLLAPVKSFAGKAATAATGFTSGPAASGSAAAAQAFARSILPAGWSWPDLLALWNQESGWNDNAVNPGSGAYGIPQSLGHGHPYNLGDYANQIRWGIAYISGRYGDSQNAWAHEVANNWYAAGGIVPPYVIPGGRAGDSGTSGHQWDAAYLAGKYPGGLSDAAAHEERFGWFDRGGLLPAGGWGFNSTNRAELVTPASGAGSMHEVAALLRQHIALTRQLITVTATTGPVVGQVISGTMRRGAARGMYGG